MLATGLRKRVADLHRAPDSRRSFFSREVNTFERLANRHSTNRVLPLRRHLLLGSVTVFLGKVAEGFQVFNLGVWTPMIVSISRNRTSLLAQLEPCIKGIAAKFEQTADMTLTVAAVFSQLRQGIVTNFGTLISPNFGRVISLTSAGVNSSNQSCVRLHQHNGQLHKSKQAFLVRSPQALSRCG